MSSVREQEIVMEPATEQVTKKTKKEKKPKKSKKEKTKKEKSKKEKSKKEKSSQNNETPLTETPVTETPLTETPVTETPVTETVNDSNNSTTVEETGDVKIENKSKLLKSDIINFIKNISSENQTELQKVYLDNLSSIETDSNIVKTLNDKIKNSKSNIKYFENLVVAEYKTNLKKKNKVKTSKRPSGFSKEYKIPSNIIKIINSISDGDFKDNSISSIALADICLKKEEGKTCNIEEEPLNELFTDYLDGIDDESIDKKYLPSKKTLESVDRTNIKRSELISFTSGLLKWLNR